MSNRPSLGMLIFPILLGLMLGAGIFLGSRLAPTQLVTADNKIDNILNYIEQEYVDTVNRQDLMDRSIEKLLEQLDPHSAYIPAAELQAANEPLEGNFEGIGIEFHIQDDSIMVVSALSGGPSERVGIMPGDRIVKVNGKTVAGINITSDQVLKTLRGKGGTLVTVSVYRRGQSGLMDFKIIRGKIPINSVEYSYMIEPGIGYIKVSRFAATTYEEFTEALGTLKKQGLRSLILDLRGNPGGFLDAATRMADEFIGGRKLVVYTQGKSRPKTSYYTEHDGLFEEGKLVVLIDDGSASASEIVSGAIQDWDRGTIIGRRSFGKGLVQEQTQLPDGSALRLTIARYYTPTGRSIQKPYADGIEAYEEEVIERYRHGELNSKDSIRFPDSLKYKTPAGRIVYGGGGIMPDIFVPIDTSYETPYLYKLFATGTINQFAYDYTDQHRQELKKFTNAEVFIQGFAADETLLNEFTAYAEKKGVKKNEEEMKRSKAYLRTQLKAFIGRLLYQNAGRYPVIHEQDPDIRKAVSVLKTAA